MKFFWTKTDSIYKIIKTLEKLPNGKQVEIFIDPEHSIFENVRWGQQIKEIIDKKNLDAVFSTKNRKNKDYYQEAGLKVVVIKERKIQYIVSFVYLFLFNIKKFHLYAYEWKKYIFGLMIAFEAFLWILVIGLFVSLIFPSAVVAIQSAENREDVIYNIRYYPNQDTSYESDLRYLSIPYYTGSIEYQYDLMISVSNVEYLISPAAGKLKVYNTLPQSFSLVWWTRFVTSDWLVFRALEWFEIMTGSVDRPAETTVSVQAVDMDDNDQIIGVRWNIASWTKLSIKNLNESYYLNAIWAESLGNFQGWSSRSEWKITEKDIAILTWKLIEQVYRQKLDVVWANFGIPDAVFLPFDSLTTTKFNLLTGDWVVWNSSSTIKGTAYVTYTFHYVKWEDLVNIFTMYVKERSTQQNKVFLLDKDSLAFLKDSSSSEPWDFRINGNIYIISTKIAVLEWYDFEQDINHIFASLKSDIAWKTIKEARDWILTNYDEIWSVDIKVSPFWYNSISNIKSRIRLEIKNVE